MHLSAYSSSCKSVLHSRLPHWATLPSMIAPDFSIAGSWRLLHTSYSHQQYLLLRLVSSLCDTQVTDFAHSLLVLCWSTSACQHANTVVQMDKFQLYRCLLQRPFVASYRQDYFSAKLLHIVCSSILSKCFPCSLTLDKHRLPALQIHAVHPAPDHHVSLSRRQSLGDSLF